MSMQTLQEKLVARTWRLPASLAKRLKLAAASTGSTIEQTAIAAIERAVSDVEAAHQADVRTFIGGR